MRSLVFLQALCVANCSATAINPYRYARDITVGPPLQVNPTDPPALSPAESPSNPTSTVPDSTRALVLPRTRPLSTTNVNPPLPVSSKSAESIESQPTPLSLDPRTICNSTTANPSLANYTQPYACSLKHGADYALFGMYYDTCSLLAFSSSASAFPSTAAPMTTLTSLPMLPSPSDDIAPNSLPSATRSRSQSNTDTIPMDTVFCCDPKYSAPQTFEALCIWGNGINIANFPPGFNPRNISRPAGAAGVGRCMVRPIIRPRARCVQVGQHEV